MFDVHVDPLSFQNSLHKMPFRFCNIISAEANAHDTKVKKYKGHKPMNEMNIKLWLNMWHSRTKTITKNGKLALCLYLGPICSSTLTSPIDAINIDDILRFLLHKWNKCVLLWHGKSRKNPFELLQLERLTNVHFLSISVFFEGNEVKSNLTTPLYKY